jgi:hypothetical protein
VIGRQLGALSSSHPPNWIVVFPSASFFAVTLLNE